MFNWDEKYHEFKAQYIVANTHLYIILDDMKFFKT